MRRLRFALALPPTNKRFVLRAHAWSIIARSSFLFFFILAQGCGKKAYDIDSEQSRKEMVQAIRNALTINDCNTAIDLSTLLYVSKYSSNEIRMLYASSHGCNAGINFYALLDDITTNDFTTFSKVLQSLVKMFPSRTALDSRLQSGWFAQDAMQASWARGAVVSGSDLIYSTTYNPGSLLYRDRTADSNLFLIFVAMSEIGTALNRYGFLSTDNPAATSYVKTTALTWSNTVAVKVDTTGAACGLASSFYNLADAIDASATIMPSNASTSLTSISTVLITGLDTAGRTNCTVVDGFSTVQCNVAVNRLRYRSSCTEQDPISSISAGIIQAINAGWI